MNYRRLFSPLTVNGMELKNRIVMTALQCNYTPDGYCSDRFTRFYEERAKGGAGLLIVGGCRFDRFCGSTWDMMSLMDDSYIEGYRAFTNIIRQYGAKTAVQLYHAGRYAKERYLKGEKALAPSSLPCSYTREAAREMTLEDIQGTISRWAEGAVRAQKAGFDAVELVGSAGYLISQFLSPLTNRRADQYGGSWENRTRFPLELLRAVRAAVGPDYPILFRISGNDFVEGSNHNEDAVRFARLLDQEGADLISVTGGWHETNIPQLPGEVPSAAYAYLGAAVKEAVHCPVLVSNRIGQPAAAENLLAMENADLIGMCRTLIAEPEWPRKVQEQRCGEIRPCVACNQGCLANTFFGKSVQCLTNGLAGQEGVLELGPAARSHKILVVGGGPGGCEFAVRAAQSGHRVTLAEQAPSIGGWTDIVAAPPGKHDFQKLAPYFQTMLAKTGVEVRLNETVTAEDVQNSDYDDVVVATGGAMRRLSFQEDDGSVEVVTADQVLAGQVIPGRRVVVLGGGAVGCETAQYLAHNSALSSEQLMFLSVHRAEEPEKISQLLNSSQREITILELAPKAYGGFDLGCAWPVVKDLKRFHIPVHTSTAVSALRGGAVHAQRTEAGGAVTPLKLPCDTLVLATGTVPRRELYDELRECWQGNAYLIGNAEKTGRILDAIHQADALVQVIGARA